jgi:hypothetical protein
MGEESTNCLIQRAEHALGAPVLCRGVGARHAQRNAVFVIEITGGVVVKLAAVVCLEGKDREVEVCGRKGMKLTDCSKSIRLEPQWVCPGKVTVVIKQQEIVSKTR